MDMMKFEMKQLRRSMITWALVLGGIMLLYLLFYPSMKSSDFAELFNQKMNLIPKEMQSAFNLNAFIDFSDLRQYFAYISQFLFIAADVYAVMLGAGILSREESNRTIEFLYAQPVSRPQIVTAKLVAAFLTLILFNFIFGAITLTIAMAVRPADLAVPDLVTTVKAVFIGQFLVQSCFLSIGLAISALMSNASRSTSLGMASFFFTYIAGILASTIKELDWLRYLSPSNYLSTAQMAQGNLLAGEYGLIMLLVSLLSISIAYYYYSRKDFQL